MKTFKLLLMLIVVAATLGSCGKDPESQEIRFSILGDSYSTFEGYVDPGTNDVWPYYEDIHVTDVGQMWWHQLADSTGDKDWHHPSIAGQTIIAQQLLEALALDGVIF